MGQRLVSLPRAAIDVDVDATLGPLEWWRHGLGHGGINSAPLPPRVVDGVRTLKPRLIRIFLQEFFQVYPDHGRFDWSRLDPYLDALAQTGAKIVAAITIKPRALFPTIDQAVWEPTDVGEWQTLIAELVRRYSVEKPLVTHWEIANETDIGEDGGAPYLIRDAAAYAQFYRMTIQPIRDVFPAAQVGGPATTWVEAEPLPGFLKICADQGTPLDFVTWHLYDDDPARHAAGVEKAKAYLSDFPGRRPELMVTEWNKGFDPVSVEELAFEPRRAAIAAASLLSMLEAGLDWSFYYHIWDQVSYPDQFAPFFSQAGVENMVTHWNEVPHRFGLFGVDEEVRPQYFLFQMLSRLGDQRVSAHSENPDVRALAARDDGSTSVLLVNHSLETSQDQVLTIRFHNLRPGRKCLTVCRLDAERRWSAESLQLLPIERREVFAPADFRCQVYCPADSVTWVSLESRDASGS